MSEHVIVTDEAGIRTIRMNRPDKKNALTHAMYDAMTAALDSANTDDAMRCVVIAGVPGAFSAGNDLADFLAAARAIAASIARRCVSCRRSSAAASRWSRR